jgi:hypothetical protein
MSGSMCVYVRVCTTTNADTPSATGTTGNDPPFAAAAAATISAVGARDGSRVADVPGVPIGAAFGSTIGSADGSADGPRVGAVVARVGSAVGRVVGGLNGTRTLAGAEHLHAAADASTTLARAPAHLRMYPRVYVCVHTRGGVRVSVNARAWLKRCEGACVRVCT